MKNNTIVKDTFALTLITLIAGVLLGLVYNITAEPIAAEQARSKAEAYQAVFQDADSFEVVADTEVPELESYLDENGYTADNIDEVMQAVDASGNPLGYAFTVTSSQGYGGDIQLAMGVQSDGTVNGISFLSISETAGLGMKADTDDFKNQYAGKQVEKFEYTKSGATQENQIDAISGATITTNAVTDAVNAGLCAFQYYEEGGSEA